jgi:hypothetical protein
MHVAPITTAASAVPFAVLQTLYESSVAFGMRKALMTEQGKGEMESHIGQMEGGIKDLERQVRQMQWAEQQQQPTPYVYSFSSSCALLGAGRRAGFPSSIHQYSVCTVCAGLCTTVSVQLLYHQMYLQPHVPSLPAVCHCAAHHLDDRCCLVLQVQEWKLKCEAIEKREAERRESEAKKHKEEVAYLENYARQLKGQLEAFFTPAKKGAGAAAAVGGQPVMQAA